MDGPTDARALVQDLVFHQVAQVVFPYVEALLDDGEVLGELVPLAGFIHVVQPLLEERAVQPLGVLVVFVVVRVRFLRQDNLRVAARVGEGSVVFICTRLAGG